MSRDKIRVALVGVGIIGESHIQTYRNIPEAEIVAICDIDEARLNEIGDRYGIARRFTHIGRMLQEDGIDAGDAVAQCLLAEIRRRIDEQVKPVFTEEKAGAKPMVARIAGVTDGAVASDHRNTDRSSRAEKEGRHVWSRMGFP